MKTALKAAYWLGRFEAIEKGRDDYPRDFLDRVKADMDLLDEDSSEDDERMNQNANGWIE